MTGCEENNTHKALHLKLVSMVGVCISGTDRYLHHHPLAWFPAGGRAPWTTFLRYVIPKSHLHWITPAIAIATALICPAQLKEGSQRKPNRSTRLKFVVELGKRLSGLSLFYPFYRVHSIWVLKNHPPPTDENKTFDGNAILWQCCFK